jgi:hypothetical protein
MMELALLFPPLTRWLIGFLLVVAIVTIETLFGLLIYVYLYGREE